MELFALPNELILQIFKHIGDPRTLVAVTCTCRKFKHIAEIFLFSRLVLTRRSSLNQILTLCNDDDRRATYVHDLQLMFSTRHYDFIDSQAVDLRQFSCLRSFASESPFCNPHSRIGGKDDTTWKADLRAFLYAFEEASLLKCPLGAARPLSQLRCRKCLSYQYNVDGHDSPALQCHWTGQQVYAVGSGRPRQSAPSFCSQLSVP